MHALPTARNVFLVRVVSGSGRLHEMELFSSRDNPLQLTGCSSPVTNQSMGMSVNFDKCQQLHCWCNYSLCHASFHVNSAFSNMASQVSLCLSLTAVFLLMLPWRNDQISFQQCGLI